MIHERIFLDGSDSRVYIDTYVSDVRNFVRDAMLVIPGGGYSNVCQEREGEPIALAYLSKGYNAFVLNYRVGEQGDAYPKQLIDAARAVLHIKREIEIERYYDHMLADASWRALFSSKNEFEQ